MNFSRILYFILTLVMASCMQPSVKKDSSQEIETTSYKVYSSLSWGILESHFLKENIVEFNFNGAIASPVDVANLNLVDSMLFKQLIDIFPDYKLWQDQLKIYFYSKNTLANNSYGIFFAAREFEGLFFSFDLIQLDNYRRVLHKQNIAKAWEEGSCWSYLNAQIGQDMKSMTQHFVQNCFVGSSVDSISKDSVILEYSINELNFNLIRVDTVKI